MDSGLVDKTPAWCSRHTSNSERKQKRFWRGLVESGASVFGKHFTENFLHRYGMAAGLPFSEELTTAAPFPIHEPGKVSIMGSFKINGKISNMNSVPLPSVSISFFDSAYYIGPHRFFPTLFYHHIHQPSRNIYGFYDLPVFQVRNDLFLIQGKFFSFIFRD